MEPIGAIFAYRYMVSDAGGVFFFRGFAECVPPIFGGDVKERLAQQNDQLENKSSITYSSHKTNDTKLLAGCFISENRNPKELTGLLLQTLAYEQRTEGKQKIMEDGLRNEDVAKNLIGIYTSVLNKNTKCK